MNAPGRLLAALLIGFGAAGAAGAHDDLETALARLEWSIQADPGALGDRLERAWLLLDHERPEQAVADIGRLLAHPEWRAEGRHLEARLGHMRGDQERARASLLASLREGGREKETEKRRLLARIELARGDTAAALREYHRVWEARGSEADFLALLEIRRARGTVTSGLLDRGLEAYPAHPAAIEAIFSACLDSGRTGHRLRKALALSRRAQAEWWPENPDWKVRHARLLIASGRSAEAGPVLMEALEWVDTHPRLALRGGEAPALRRAIFALLPAAREPGRPE